MKIKVDDRKERQGEEGRYKKTKAVSENGLKQSERRNRKVVQYSRTATRWRHNIYF